MSGSQVWDDLSWSLVLGLRDLPQVTIIGDTTAGIFADFMVEVLPNGWRVQIPNTLFLDNDGR